MSKDNERIQNNNVENGPEGTESERTVKFPWLIFLYTFLVLVITSVSAYMYFVLHKEKMGAYLPFALFACVITNMQCTYALAAYIKQYAKKEEEKNDTETLRKTRKGNRNV